MEKVSHPGPPPHAHHQSPSQSHYLTFMVCLLGIKETTPAPTKRQTRVRIVIDEEPELTLRDLELAPAPVWGFGPFHEVPKEPECKSTTLLGGSAIWTVTDERLSNYWQMADHHPNTYY
ncbi:hypothetical protein AAC387_Pa05g3623 [Persea americana]